MFKPSALILLDRDVSSSEAELLQSWIRSICDPGKNWVMQGDQIFHISNVAQFGHSEPSCAGMYGLCFRPATMEFSQKFIRRIKPPFVNLRGDAIYFSDWNGGRQQRHEIFISLLLELTKKFDEPIYFDHFLEPPNTRFQTDATSSLAEVESYSARLPGKFQIYSYKPGWFKRTRFAQIVDRKFFEAWACS